jgi:hypothetical protein
MQALKGRNKPRMSVKPHPDEGKTQPPEKEEIIE